MTYIDRGRAASDQGMIRQLGPALAAKKRPDNMLTSHARTPVKAVFGLASDLDFVLQLVDRMEALHEENPDADISLDINETCKASLIDVSGSSNVQHSGRAA